MIPVLVCLWYVFRMLSSSYCSGIIRLRERLIPKGSRWKLHFLQIQSPHVHRMNAAQGFPCLDSAHLATGLARHQAGHRGEAETFSGTTDEAPSITTFQ